MKQIINTLKIIIPSPVIILLLNALLVMGLLTNVQQSVAQNNFSQANEKAIVMLDGKFLFNVGNIENFTASERAELINDNLAKEVKNPQPVKLAVLLENQQVVIRNILNNQHILNV
ncbi:MAG: hypothetical protein AAGF26_01445, partial [Cyanobacteria bacterium P01_G01_bin.49]